MRSRRQVADEWLVLASQAGEVEAFERLAERWHPRMLRHARRLTLDAEGANEAVQDAWVAIARGLRRLRDPARFGPWALRITGRRCADWIARQRQDRQHSIELDAASAVAAAVPERDRDEPLARLRDALRRLDAEQRVLMALFYLDGLSVGQIAGVLGIPAGTVKSRLFHARERLRAAVEA